MADYRQRFFDQCLVAVVTELVCMEEEQPEWPDNLFHAAALVSEKAGELLRTSANQGRQNGDDRDRILREATRTGAMALRFLLNMHRGLRYEMRAIEWESCLEDALD
ncbi:MAG: hypothetical protein JSV16_02120 [Candidatus Hydrogenedentota bacterium]|nr:MAG: hypothetical protein JSV16_02120 [Candidatus Hydrogenedentota bacterium]